MFNPIVKLIRLYKMFKFEPNGDLSIHCNGSYIRMTKQGDIILNAKRAAIHNYRLQFNDCPQDFVQGTIESYEKGNHLDFVRKANIEDEVKAEIACQISEQ